MKHLESTAREEHILLRNLKDFESFCATLVAMVEVRVAGTAVAERYEYKSALRSAGLFATTRQQEQKEARLGFFGTFLNIFVRRPDASHLDGWEDSVKQQIDEIQTNTPMQRLFKIAGFDPVVYISDDTALLYAIPDYESLVDKAGIELTRKGGK